MTDNNGSGTKSVIKKYDDQEDLEIKRAAFERDNIFAKYIFCVEIILFGILFSTCILIYKNYSSKNNNAAEIKNYTRNVEIINDGRIDEVIKNDIFKEDKYKITKIDKIRVSGEENSKIKYNVKYRIYENDFKINPYATSTSDVLVKFSYSYDNDKWTYTNNVIRLDDIELKTVSGSSYDISGLVGILKVSSDNLIKIDDEEDQTIYWRSETIFKKPKVAIDNTFKAYFYIEYVEMK